MDWFANISSVQVSYIEHMRRYKMVKRHSHWKDERFIRRRKSLLHTSSWDACVFSYVCPWSIVGRVCGLFICPVCSIPVYRWKVSQLIIIKMAENENLFYFWVKCDTSRISDMKTENYILNTHTYRKENVIGSMVCDVDDQYVCHMRAFHFSVSRSYTHSPKTKFIEIAGVWFAFMTK